MLTDQYGRTHNYLRISLTDKCNLRCTYCMPKEDMVFSPKEKLMSASEIQTLATHFVATGVNKIRLTGGEPLVRKDFDEIFKNLSELPVSMHLTTNGVTLHKHLDHLIKHGLKDINISLDTLQKSKFEAITRRDNLNIVMQNIQLALSAGLNVKVNTVLLKNTNEDEITRLIELGKEQELHIRFIEFMPFMANEWEYEKTILKADVIRFAEEKFGQIEKLNTHKNSTSNNFKVKGFKGDFGVISTISDPFCGGCNRIRLTADGKIKNCLFSSSEFDLLTKLRNNEDVKSIIEEAIYSKKKSRGGMSDQIDIIENGALHKNRSMIAIGG